MNTYRRKNNMIHTHEIPDGIILDAQPFTKPSKNADARIIAEIKSSSGNRRDVRFRLCNMDGMMTLTDVVILTNAIRALVVKVQDRMVQVQEEAKTKRKRKRAKK